MDMRLLDVRKEVAHQVVEEYHLEREVAEVSIALDISGSMRAMYQSGQVQEVLERLLPIAMEFDDNGAAELYLFHDGAYQHPTDITVRSLPNLVQREIMGKYSFGGTNYAPVINMIRGVKPTQEPKKGFSFGKIFSSKSVETSSVGARRVPKYVIFITDGENSDRLAAEKAIIESSGEGIFFQFVGLGSSSFEFLEQLDTMPGRIVDNANFFQVNDIHLLSDVDLYHKLLAEFPDYLEKARQAGVLIR